MSNSVRNWRRQKKIRQNHNVRGTVISWTEIFTAPPQFQKQAPYVIVLVELESGEKMYGQLVEINPVNVKQGLKVRSIIRLLEPGITSEDVIAYGLKFVADSTE